MVSQLASESRVQGDSKEEMEEAVEHLVTKILSQRCSRVNWLDLDLRAKDKLKQAPPCTQEQKLRERQEKRLQEASTYPKLDEDDAVVDSKRDEIIKEVSSTSKG